MLDIIISSSSLLLVILLSDYQYILFGVLLIVLFILYKLNPQSIIFYMVCGIGGALAESLAVKYGNRTWKYDEPTKPLNIPLWLIPLWAIAGVFITSISKRVDI